MDFSYALVGTRWAVYDHRQGAHALSVVAEFSDTYAQAEEWARALCAHLLGIDVRALPTLEESWETLRPLVLRLEE